MTQVDIKLSVSIIMKGASIAQIFLTMTRRQVAALLTGLLFSSAAAFAPTHSPFRRLSNAALQASSDDVCTVQILISDTGGGHRASANALRDAFDSLYPGRIECDIVDIYTDYGPIWPYNDYPAMYKLMAKYPITWDIFYHGGSTDLGICVNTVLLDTFCYDSFKECLSRPAPSTGTRADMVVSVHPLTQDIPLAALAELDSGTRDMAARTTPFCTVVTDLGSAHPTWFHPR